jgi:uncharacterized protein (UPF0333 family)
MMEALLFLAVIFFAIIIAVYVGVGDNQAFDDEFWG